MAAQAALLRLAGPDAQPVLNPVAELTRLAGEVRSWQQAARQLVGDLDDGALVTEDDIHPLVKLAERADERLAKILTEMVKVGLESKRVEIDQATSQLLMTTLQTVLRDQGFDPSLVLPELGQRLRAIETGGG